MRSYIKLAAVAALALSGSDALAAAAAAPKLPRSLKEALKAATTAAPARPRTKATRQTDCANFAGHWHGTCTDQDGSTASEDMTIEQDDCDTIVDSGLALSIGGANLVHGTDRYGASYLTLFPRWNT